MLQLTYGTLIMGAGFLLLAALGILQLIAAGWLVALARTLHDAEDVEKRLVLLSGACATLKKELGALTDAFESYRARKAVTSFRARKAEEKADAVADDLAGFSEQDRALFEGMPGGA